MIKKVVIVGFGNIGFRHLQGIMNDCKDLKVHIIDNDPHSGNRISKEMSEKLIRKNIVISFNSNYEELYPEVDYVIIATLSNVRFSVLEQLLRNTRPKSILFEKVLFDRREHYDLAIKLVDSLNIDALTNCWRRIFPAYKRAKEFLGTSQSPISFVNISGGDIGLGCNGVHFMDLIAFFSGEKVVITKDELDSGVIESKRDSFVEFSGRLEGFSGQTKFVIDSKRNNDQQVVVELISEDMSVIVREADNKVFLKNFLNGDEIIEEHRTPFLSEVSGGIAKSVFEGNLTGLPALRDTSNTHQVLLDILSAHAAKYIDVPDGFYPVT